MANELNKNYIKLTPKDCLKLNFEQSFSMLETILGKELLKKALSFEVPSPLKNQTTTDWCRNAKIVGINPRITKTFWGIVKYAMTFPENAVHLMPLFETGDGSLYVQNSWGVNGEFLDTDLAKLGFETPEKQLKLVVNILHALGKAVGFDALPHVDNFSEIVLLNPTYFEWVRLAPDKTAQDFSVETENLGNEIENLIISNYNLPKDFFALEEGTRRRMLFPEEVDEFSRRMEVRKLIRDNGYEPIPVVEHAPMRPVMFDRMEYSADDSWAVFSVKNKSDFAKIIGSVTPYKFYKIKDGYPVKNTFDNRVLEYFIGHLKAFQQEYGFDFLRADMAHNQLAHSHNEEKDFVCEEFWAKVKSEIRKTTPYFGSFAESFWGDYYVAGVQDMKNKDFDIVLGMLNFHYLDESFIRKIKEQYSSSSPYSSVTVFTNDGDLPEHDNLYTSQEANECRFFISLFLNSPSYVGMGYETRDLKPDSDNKYSNVYVKPQQKEFEFGENEKIFDVISQMRDIYIQYRDFIAGANLFFDNNENGKILSWYYKKDGKILLFAVNLDNDKTEFETSIEGWSNAKLIYTNSRYNELEQRIASTNGSGFYIQNFYIGECVIYELE